MDEAVGPAPAALDERDGVAEEGAIDRCGTADPCQLSLFDFVGDLLEGAVGLRRPDDAETQRVDDVSAGAAEILLDGGELELELDEQLSGERCDRGLDGGSGCGAAKERGEVLGGRAAEAALVLAVGSGVRAPRRGPRAQWMSWSSNAGSQSVSGAPSSTCVTTERSE